MDIMVKVEALTNFTKQALLDSTKAIQALNEEQIQMTKAVIQDRMALDMLTAAQGGTCAIIKVECCVYIPELSENVSTALEDMQNQMKAMSNENIPFWTSVLSWVKGDWWKTILTVVLDHTALWALLPTMPCEFCNPEVDSILSCGWQEGEVTIYLNK